mmetsp:Transcript_20961/g.45452  ORF Transcript_20961/g.45452 Transcript_20961/m.45452 type:complete len:437 (-) Transcript_20961:159-1469(-)|eukprot:CAMPEP_0172306418 /NCGR_PEP_ID=MMETSP1058-20130122/7495_1 /TAXON_ID=83371 /ORGANISM="Detonula confervacea, Strain CCMP 353" /LENGTH=436 /DNA_ID=CAMNT_0013018299 /DNA_START=183 /DNA_END=1493 /DNA_ORIENTATION=-
MAETTIEATHSSGGSTIDALLRFFWRCGTVLTGVVAIAMGVLYVKQESLLYFPSIGGVPRHPSDNPRRYRTPSEHNIPFETHMIPCADGTTIHSWLLYHPENGPNQKKVPTIIYFHGNAGNIGLRLPNAMQMYHHLKANIWLIEYRGFGDSDDVKPTESGLKLDAEAVWNYANNPQTRNMHSVDPKRLFVFGRSLGGAVAFHLAQYSQSTSYPPLAGVIIENTFLSISEMVDHLMPYVAPFKVLILRMSWNSGQIAPTIRMPTLFLAGAKDTLVPHSHMLELFNRMKSSKVGNLVRMHVVEDGTHNETWMQGGREYWMAIQRFIDEVFAAERPSGASYSRSASTSGVHNQGPIQRKGSTGLTSILTSASAASSSGDCSGKMQGKDSVEVKLGCDGGDAADMISSVGNFMGMAREATKSVAGGVKGTGVAGAYKKKD